MSDETEVGSLADELRRLATVLADHTDGGADELVERLRERLAATSSEGATASGDDPVVERIDLS